jgi:hypothetical protein
MGSKSIAEHGVHDGCLSRGCPSVAGARPLRRRLLADERDRFPAGVNDLTR